MQIAGADHARIQVRAFQRGQDRHAQDLEVRSRRAFLGRAHDMGIAMHRQEIQIKGRQPAHGGFHRGADVEQLHVQEDPLAVIPLQLVGKRQPAAGQHPQPDLVEADGIAQPFRKVQPRQGVRHVQCHDQPVIHA